MSSGLAVLDMPCSAGWRQRDGSAVYHHGSWWYTFWVPTTKHRHQVTETPEVAHALEVAARRWPGKSRSALLAALAAEGAKAIEHDEDERREARRKLVEANAGGFEDAYPPGYLDELRKDWPD